MKSFASFFLFDLLLLVAVFLSSALNDNNDNSNKMINKSFLIIFQKNINTTQIKREFLEYQEYFDLKFGNILIDFHNGNGKFYILYNTY